MCYFAINSERFHGTMRGVQDRYARGFVHTSRLHSNESVFNDVDASNTVLAANPIQSVEKGSGRQRFAINGNWNAGIEFDLKIHRLVRCIFRRASEYEDV